MTRSQGKYLTMDNYPSRDMAAVHLHQESLAYINLPPGVPPSMDKTGGVIKVRPLCIVLLFASAARPLAEANWRGMHV